MGLKGKILGIFQPIRGIAHCTCGALLACVPPDRCQILPNVSKIQVFFLAIRIIRFKIRSNTVFQYISQIHTYVDLYQIIRQRRTMVLIATYTKVSNVYTIYHFSVIDLLVQFRGFVTAFHSNLTTTNLSAFPFSNLQAGNMNITMNEIANLSL